MATKKQQKSDRETFANIRTRSPQVLLHLTIGDIVMDARANAFNAVMAAAAKADPNATVDVTSTLFREAWQEATPPADDLQQPKVTSEHAELWDRLVTAVEQTMALTEAETEKLVENLIPAIMADDDGQSRADALSCTLSQIRGIVEIAIDTIEEQDPCTVGTRMCDATAALYGVVALAKGK